MGRKLEIGSWTRNLVVKPKLKDLAEQNLGPENMVQLNHVTPLHHQT